MLRDELVDPLVELFAIGGGALVSQLARKVVLERPLFEQLQEELEELFAVLLVA